MLTDQLHAQQIILLFKQLGVKNIIISPGSRNAPLTISFSNDDYFNCLSIVDERCAAHVGLGMAQQSRTPSVLVCTSGSALLNYYPAITEAFYSQIPLIVLSADRPRHKIDIGDGQTIRQENVYANHILYSTSLSIIDQPSQQDLLDKNSKQLLKAVTIALDQQGPVHINVPFEEPLYNTVDQALVSIAFAKATPQQPSYIDTHIFLQDWQQAQRKLVLIATLSPDTIDPKLLERLINDPSVIVLTEVSSNIVHKQTIWSIDSLIAPLEQHPTMLQNLQPDLVITIGGMIVSKKIKQFLRSYPASSHYHIGYHKANDTFGYLKQHLNMPVNTWLETLPNLSQDSDYQLYVSSIYKEILVNRKRYIDQLAWSDFKVFDIIFSTIPSHRLLQLSNSSTIRYAQLFSMNPTHSIFANRGTSGIDGSTSTAIGAAIAHHDPTIFITGDLSFFYDANALWNQYIPNHFKIILINNQGGGIFRILPGDKDTENFERFFETSHELNASYLCAMHGFQYHTASSENELINTLPKLLQQDERPQLLEIFTPRRVNDTVLLDYFKKLYKN